MRDLDDRLRAGPLRVASLWTPDRSAHVARHALRRRRAIALMLAGGCVAAGLAALLYLLPGATAPSQPLGDAPGLVRFADGSSAEPYGPAADLRVEEQTAQRVRVRLNGAARFEVAPNRARSFEVRAGEVLVRVLGTAFSVDRQASRTRVAVEHGRVQVSWAGGSALLIGGEVGTFPPAEDAAWPRAPQQDAPQVMPSATPVAGEQSATTPTRRAARDEAADLMLAADVARLSAHPEAAIEPLRKLCARYPQDKRAPVAAFTLGRVLDELGRAAEDAAAFERARTLWPAGPLAEDALSRAAEAWQRAGRTAHAQALAAEYLRRFPEGRHAASMRETLARDR